MAAYQRELRSFRIDQNFNALVDAARESTGILFTRFVTAGLLQYLLGNLREPDALWMRLAEGLDSGSMSFPDVIVSIAEEKLFLLDQARAATIDDAKARGEPVPREGGRAKAQRALYKHWIALIAQAERDGLDPMDAVTAQWLNHCQPIRLVEPPVLVAVARPDDDPNIEEGV